MKIAALVARIVLGLAFTAAGILGFVSTPPPEPGLAGTFAQAFYGAHWSWFVALAQLAIGVLLLLGRFVPLALMMLGAFLYNSLAYHVTMMPQGLPIFFIATALWLVVCWRYRSALAPLLAPTTPGLDSPADRRRTA